MIPVYNKGEYLLRVEPPPGWSFGKIKPSRIIKTSKIFYSNRSN